MSEESLFINDIKFPSGHDDIRILMNDIEHTMFYSVLGFKMEEKKLIHDELEISRREAYFYTRIKSALEIFRKSKGWPQD